MIVKAPIPVTGDEGLAAVRVQDAARAVILRHYGEPDAGKINAH